MARNDLIGKRVRLIGSHPHGGDSGKIVAFNVSLNMYEVDLSDCEHGTAGCFAEPHHIRLLTENLTRIVTLDDGR